MQLPAEQLYETLKNIYTNGLTIHQRRYDNGVFHNFVRLLTYKQFHHVEATKFLGCALL